MDAIRMTMTTAGTPRSMRDAMARMVSNRHTAATALTGASVSTLQASQSKGNSSEEIFGGADGSTQVRDGQVLYDDGSVVRGGDSGVQMVASAGGTGGSEGGRAMEKVAQAEELMGKEGVSGSGGVDSVSYIIIIGIFVESCFHLGLSFLRHAVSRSPAVSPACFSHHTKNATFVRIAREDLALVFMTMDPPRVLF